MIVDDFTSGNANVQVSALQINTNLFGGSAMDWERATLLDEKGSQLVPSINDCKAGEA